MPKCDFCNCEETENTYYVITKIENDDKVSQLCFCSDCSIKYRDFIIAYFTGRERLE